MPSIHISHAYGVQSEVESQYSELLTQSQADMSVSNDDEDDVERDLRELNQTLIQMQQELMSAQAGCDRARAAEEEALSTWVSKRSACTIGILSGTLDISQQLLIHASMDICSCSPLSAWLCSIYRPQA